MVSLAQQEAVMAVFLQEGVTILALISQVLQARTQVLFTLADQTRTMTML